MNKVRENIVPMYPERETESATHLGSKDQTILDRVCKVIPSVRKALSFSMLQNEIGHKKTTIPSCCQTPATNRINSNKAT